MIYITYHLSGAWQGNQCKKFLGLAKAGKGKTWKDVLDTLKQLVLTSALDNKTDVVTFLDKICTPLISKLVEIVKFIIRAEPMDDETIEAGCKVCEDYVDLYRKTMHVDKSHPLLKEKLSITPKMHILEVHIPEFARQWRTVGFFGEDVVETLHKNFNKLLRRLCSIRNPLDEMKFMDDAKNLTGQRTAEVKKRGRKRKTASIVVDRAAAIRQRVLDIDDGEEDDFSIEVGG